VRNSKRRKPILSPQHFSMRLARLLHMAVLRNRHICQHPIFQRQRSVLMLVLTRKARQQIQIGPYVTITILAIKGQAVRVGIEAPKDVSVLRMELAEKLAAGSFDPTVLAAMEKVDREAEISSTPGNEDTGGRAKSANGSLRCRVSRVDKAPSSLPTPSTGPASFIRPRRRRLTMK
jgi:carbon storage regulator